jgi:hypothetical protein
MFRPRSRQPPPIKKAHDRVHLLKVKILYDSINQVFDFEWQRPGINVSGKRPFFEVPIVPRFGTWDLFSSATPTVIKMIRGYSTGKAIAVFYAAIMTDPYWILALTR